MRVFLFLLMIGNLAFAQIEAKNGQIVWRNITEYGGTSENLLKLLKSSGKFSSLEALDGTIIGKFVNAPIKYKGTASMYLMASNLAGSFMVVFKEDRYRITVRNIQLESQTGVGVFDEGSIQSIEKFAFNSKGEFRKRFKSKDIPIIDDSISQIFKISSEDDW